VRCTVIQDFEELIGMMVDADLERLATRR